MVWLGQVVWSEWFVKQGSFWGFSQNDKMLSLKDIKLKKTWNWQRDMKPISNGHKYPKSSEYNIILVYPNTYWFIQVESLKQD